MTHLCDVKVKSTWFPRPLEPPQLAVSSRPAFGARRPNGFSSDFKDPVSGRPGQNADQFM